MPEGFTYTTRKSYDLADTVYTVWLGDQAIGECFTLDQAIAMAEAYA